MSKESQVKNIEKVNHPSEALLIHTLGPNLKTRGNNSIFQFHNVPENQVLEIGKQLNFQFFKTPFGVFACGTFEGFKTYISSIDFGFIDSPFLILDKRVFKVENIYFQFGLKNIKKTA